MARNAKEHKVKLEKVIRSNKEDSDEYMLGHGHKTLPFDLPVSIGVSRYVGPLASEPKVPEMKGWAITINFYTCGNKKLIIKVYREPSAVVVLWDGKEIIREKGNA